jgi:hypothetical protein
MGPVADIPVHVPEKDPEFVWNLIHRVITLVPDKGLIGVGVGLLGDFLMADE